MLLGEEEEGALWLLIPGTKSSSCTTVYVSQHPLKVFVYLPRNSQLDNFFIIFSALRISTISIYY